MPLPSPTTSDTRASSTRREAIIPIGKYRQLTNDYESSDQKILERLDYLEDFSRVIIRSHLEAYAKKRN